MGKKRYPHLAFYSLLGKITYSILETSANHKDFSMIKDNRIKGENTEYEYYSLSGNPVRVVLDDYGFAISADGLDCLKREFVRDLTLILPAQNSPYSVDITEQEFHDLCDKLIQKTAQ